MISLGSHENWYITADSVGGVISRCIFKGIDVIFPLKKLKAGKKRGGLPICFPFFGLPSLAPLAFGKHGWLRNQRLHYKKKSNQCSFIPFYLWSDKSDAYFCVEPVLLPYESFNTKGGFFLQKNEKMEMSMILEIIDYGS